MKKPKYVTDPEDGLPALTAGSWADTEKITRVRRYVDASRAARRKWLPPHGRGGATYVDPYCGPGRLMLRETGQFVDGGCLAAVRMAAGSDTSFSQVLIGDADQRSTETATTRLAALGAVSAFVGPADETVDRILGQISPYALTFAFLDPYNLATMPFSIIERLASCNRIDMLIHVSLMDLQRQLPKWRAAGDFRALDAFAPGCSAAIDLELPQDRVRLEIFHYWMNLVRSLNLDFANSIPLVTGPKNINLYWLAFAARNRLAHTLWDAIANLSPQRSLL